MTNSTRNCLIVAIVFVAALGSVLRLESAEEGKKLAIQQWEYEYTSDMDRLQVLGKEGWELVAAATHGNNAPTLYLKRAR